ncbi:MAG: cation transporter [Saprospiraceae bacterium]|nr:cation transporter [Saprospiraceae bacterium]
MTMIFGETQSKISIQRYIFIGGIILFAIKVVAFYITNSVGILSDALESTVNVITGFITLKSLQFAVKPRDEDHPYGHGKVELITASIEGILIGVAGAMIIIEAIKRLGAPPEILKMDTGIMLMLLTAIVNYLMGRYSIQKGIKNNSIALVSGGKHLISDTYTTIALIGGLVIYFITGQKWVDSFLAILFGLFILYTGYTVLRSTVNGLMDEADSTALDALVKVLRDQRHDKWINIHKLTYLKFGHVSHVDMHLTLPWYYDLRQSGTEIGHLKNIVRNNLPEEEVDISIQTEPCTENMCHQCALDCVERKHRMISTREWSTMEITGKNIFSSTLT